MNIQTFREDVRAVVSKVGQSELSRLSGVGQCNISKFLNMDREMKLSNVLRIWPFVYGDLRPQSPTLNPAEVQP